MNKESLTAFIKAMIAEGNVSGVAGAVVGLVTSIQGASIEIAGKRYEAHFPCPKCGHKEIDGGSFLNEVDVLPMINDLLILSESQKAEES